MLVSVRCPLLNFTSFTSIDIEIYDMVNFLLFFRSFTADLAISWNVRQEMERHSGGTEIVPFSNTAYNENNNSDGQESV